MTKAQPTQSQARPYTDLDPGNNEPNFTATFDSGSRRIWKAQRESAILRQVATRTTASRRYGSNLAGLSVRDRPCSGGPLLLSDCYRTEYCEAIAQTLSGYKYSIPKSGTISSPKPRAPKPKNSHGKTAASWDHHSKSTWSMHHFSPKLLSSSHAMTKAIQSSRNVNGLEHLMLIESFSGL